MVNSTIEHARKRVQEAVEMWVLADRECGELILQYVATSNVPPEIRAKPPKRAPGADSFKKLRAAQARLDAARKRMDAAIAYLEKLAKTSVKSR